jgi:hypothetical protein
VAGCRSFYSPTSATGEPSRDTSTYTTSQLAAQEPVRLNLERVIQGQGQGQGQGRQHSQHEQRDFSNRQPPSASYSERSQATAGDSSRASWRPAVQLETMSQAIGLHQVVEPSDSERSFSVIGASGVAARDPYRHTGNVVPGYSGHRPGDIHHFGTVPRFVPPSTAQPRSPYKQDIARVHRPTTAWQEIAAPTAMPHRPHQALQPTEDRTDPYKEAVGGVVAGYTGHVPGSQTHFGTPACAGGLIDAGSRPHTAQRDHEHTRLGDLSKEFVEETSERAIHSVPGYGGHCPGEQHAFGTTFWGTSPSRFIGARPSSAASASACKSAHHHQRSASDSSPSRSAAHSKFERVSRGSPPRLAAAAAAAAHTRGAGEGNPPLPPRGTDPRTRGTTHSHPMRWVPPAGLYYANRSRGLNINLWEAPEFEA